MTDTITPASLRAHADWWAEQHAKADTFRIVPDALRAEAARLEAESARAEEEAAMYAKVILEGTAGHFTLVGGSWEDCGDYARDAFRAAARAVLDRLAADGRLLHEGGMATVASDANVPVDQHTWVYCEYQDFARNCEFRCEATGCDWRGQDKAEHAEHVDRIATQERLRRNPETLARVQKAQAERDQAVRVEVTPPAVSAPDSGTDGTPEKPWEAADDIPANVEKVRDRVGKVWRRKGGGWCFMPGNSCGCTDGILDTHVAPFVRVDGDKA